MSGSSNNRRSTRAMLVYKGLCIVWGLLATGCAGGSLQWMRQLPKKKFTLTKPGIYELRAQRPKGARCELQQGGQPILLDDTKAKEPGICSLKHYFGAGTYKLAIKRPTRRKAKRYRRRRYRRPAPRATKPKAMKRWLLAYHPHQLNAGGTLSAQFREHALANATSTTPAPTKTKDTTTNDETQRKKTTKTNANTKKSTTSKGNKLTNQNKAKESALDDAATAPFVLLQSVMLRVSQAGLYRLEGTGVTRTMQLYQPKGALVAESRGGQRGEDCLLHAYLKPGTYPMVLSSGRKGPFALRTTRIATTPLKPGQSHKGALKRAPHATGYTLTLRKRTLLQLAIDAPVPLTCDLFDDAGRLLIRFHSRKGCKTARPLSAGTYALKLQTRRPTSYTAKLDSFSTKPLRVGVYRELPLQKDKPVFFRFRAKKAGSYVILSQTQTKLRYAVYDALYQRKGKVIRTRAYFHMTHYQLKQGTHYLRMLPMRKSKEESAVVILEADQLPNLGAVGYQRRTTYRNHAFQFFRIDVPKHLSYQFKLRSYPIRYSLYKHTRMGCGVTSKSLKMLATGKVVGRLCTIQTRLKPGRHYLYSIVRILPPKKKYRRLRRRRRTRRRTARVVRAALRTKPPPRRKANTLKKLPTYRYRLYAYVNTWEEHRLQVSASQTTAHKSTLFHRKSRLAFRFHNTQSGLYIFETTGRDIDPTCSLRSNQLVKRQWTYIRTLSYDNDSGEGSNCRILARLEPGYYTYQVRSYYRNRASGRLTATLKRLSPKTQPLALGIPTPIQKVKPNAPHLYAIEVKRAAFYQLLTAGHSDPNCAIYNERFRLMGAHRDNTPGQDLNCNLATFLYPGRYTLMVSLGNRHFADRAYRVLWRPYQFDPDRRLQPGRPFIAGPLQRGTPHIYLIDVPRDGVYRIESTGPSDPSCRLYNPNAEQLAYNNYIHYRKNRNCRIIQHLKRGRYLLWVKLYRTKYTGRPYEIQVTPYPIQQLRMKQPNRIPAIKSRTPLLYQIKIPKDGLYRIYTKSGPFINCVLYAGMTKRVASHGWYGCSLTRHLKRGMYTLRVNFSSYRKISGGITAYAAPLSPQELRPSRGLTLPSLSASTPTLLKLRIRKKGFYQLSSTGRARSRCELFAPPFRLIAKTAYGNTKCQLAYRLKPGEYYLRIKPYYRYDAGKAIRLNIATVKPQTIALRKTLVVPLRKSSQSFFFKIKLRKRGFYTFRSMTKLSGSCHLYDESNPKAIAKRYQRGCSITKGLSPGTYIFQSVPRIYAHYLRRGKRLSMSIVAQQLLPETLQANRNTRQRGLNRGEYHFYQFKAPKSGMYRFVTIGGADPVGTLFNSHFQDLATAYDTYTQKRSSRRIRSSLGYRVNSRTTRRSSYNFQLYAYLHKSKTYYLKVMAQRSWRNRGKYYQLKIQPMRQLISDLSVNRALTARPLKISVPHYYRVQITRNGIYEFETSGRSDTTCTLFSRGGKRLATHKNIFFKWRSKKTNLNCRITRKLPPGEYTLKIHLGNRQYAGRPYTVEVEQVLKKRRTRTTQVARSDDNRRPTTDARRGNTPTDTGDAKENLDQELSKDN